MQPEEFHIHLYGPHLNESVVADPAQAMPTSIDCSFESAQERMLQVIPELLLEPDGSLAWAGAQHQIVGIIYDRGDQIQYVELRGRCRRPQMRLLVEALVGSSQIDDFAVMTLPQRQWKNFQSFATSLPVDAPQAGL